MSHELPPAGPKLDALVAQANKHSVWRNWHPSTDEKDAVVALEDWLGQHRDWTARISFPRRNWANWKEYRVQVWRQGYYRETCVMGCALTIAEAASRALVLASATKGDTPCQQS